MLAALAIRDIVLIDRLDVGFEPRLSVLTGETGAGKSILLDALALALGARGDAALVRAGAPQGHVTAVFDLPREHPVRRLVVEGGIDDTGDDLVLRRVQMADGRTRAFVNDQPVAAQMLRAIGQALVEIHGQHDDRALVEPATHRALLDAFAGANGTAAEVARLWSVWRAASAAAKQALADLERARRDADYVAHAHAELSALAAEPGEEEALALRRQGMMAAEKIAADLKDAYETLDGAASPVPTVTALARRVERKRTAMPAHLPMVADALGRALDALEEARAVLEAALRATEFEPRDLERTEERLFALRAAARKYGVPTTDLPGLAARFATDLAALEAGESRATALEAQAREAEAAFRDAAAALSKMRRAAASRLDKAVTAELPPLKLERARFMTEVVTDPQFAGPTGCDQVNFVVQTNPGTAPGPLLKIASGGELARFLLALKVVLADRGSAPTLVFDEIDTGVGGAVAEAIGHRLARLSQRVQVLAITHAPQVAARADGHFRIEKQAVDKKRVATRVAALGAPERREEIARMLSGAVVTEEARAQAERLITGGA